MGYKKRPPEHHQFGTLRTYFTEGDPLVQYNYYSNSQIDDLTQKLKILALLNESITVAGSHVLESSITWKLLREYPEFLEQGIVVPAINDDFNSFEEMVEKKLNSNSLSRPNSPMETLDQDTLHQRAKFLENHATSVMGWSIEQMRGDFKQGLYNALSSPDTSLYQTVSEAVDPKDLKNRIESHDIISRNTIQMEIEALPQSTQQLIMGYVNANYHLVGATTHRAVPNIHHQELPQFEYLFVDGVDFNKSAIDQSFNSENSIPVEEMSLFREFLQMMDTDTRTLQLIDTSKVLDLRNQSITDDFRSSLHNIMREVHSDNPESYFQFSEIQSEFREELNNKIQTEKNRTEYATKAQNIIRTTLYAASVGSLVYHPELSAGLTITNPILQKLVEKLPDLVGNEFMTFNQQYRETVTETGST